MKSSLIAACSVFVFLLAAPALAWYEPGYLPGPPEPPGRYERYSPMPDRDRFVYSHRARIHLEKGRYEQGYLLRVYTEGIAPGDIEISVDRGRLRLRSAISRSHDWRNTEPYYQRSRMSSHTRIARSIRLPYDADPAGLQTEVTDEALEIRIPRRQNSSQE